MKLFAHSNGHDFEMEIQPDRDRIVVRFGGKEAALSFDDQRSCIRTAFLGDRRLDFGWARADGAYTIQIDGIEYRVEVRDPMSERMAKVVKAAGPAAAAEVKAPIPGLVTRVLVREGEAVRKGQPVLCLDAMKLENEIPAPRDGTLKSLGVAAGQPVEKGQVLFVIG